LKNKKAVLLLGGDGSELDTLLRVRPPTGRTQTVQLLADVVPAEVADLIN